MNTTARTPAKQGYDFSKIAEACSVLTTIEGLLSGYVDEWPLEQKSVNGLATLIRWVNEAIYQDGAFREA